MIPRLIITESARKAERLASLWPSGRARGMPTNGYLFIPLPELSPVGVKADWTDERVPRHPDWLAAMGDAISEADEIVIATDPDAEGEVIAQDVMSVVHRFSPASKTYRLRLWSLDHAAIAEGVAAMEPVDPEIDSRFWSAAQPGHVRRVIDRLCATVFGSREKPVGRVLSGFLDVAASQPVPPDGENGDGVTGPGNLADLFLAGELADLTVQQIYDEAQALYESGSISYPRTLSRVPVDEFRKAGAGLGEGAHPALHNTVARPLLHRLRDYAESEPPGLPPGMRIMVAIERMTSGGLRRCPADADPDARAILRHLMTAGLARPSTWAGFATHQAQRGLFDHRQGLTARGRQFQQWQPDWLNADFSRTMESRLTPKTPAPVQIGQLVSEMPRSAQAQIFRMISRAETHGNCVVTRHDANRARLSGADGVTVRGRR